MLTHIDVFDCQACGACCSFSADWPRFSTETEAEIDNIPASMISKNLSGMRCNEARCCALTGVVGQNTGCSIYRHRPAVCRTCVPGDAECILARSAFENLGGASH
ncbi:YkgJ family cysteine cluster protein [Aureimonas psammosilenae]|uniref:YkgJ family cysteine cluster protein n=1 Tax=Aureimonas psammosilenae TaxID=2495496 RepID=UPI001260BEC9|nr:YkgJ family cysteine cluster protein [Aureimonas psammosilenae]